MPAAEAKKTYYQGKRGLLHENDLGEEGHAGGILARKVACASQILLRKIRRELRAYVSRC